MKIPEYIAVTVLLAGVGCQSSHERYGASYYFRPEPTAQTNRTTPSYTIKIFPNDHLTPTSREGNKGPVYSSNIVGIFFNGSETNSDNP